MNIKDKIISGNSIVFLWNKNIKLEDANFFEIKKDILNILNKAKILIDR